jgi:hypothetical protein
LEKHFRLSWTLLGGGRGIKVGAGVDRNVTGSKPDCAE